MRVFEFHREEAMGEYVHVMVYVGLRRYQVYKNCGSVLFSPEEWKDFHDIVTACDGRSGLTATVTEEAQVTIVETKREDRDGSEKKDI